MKWSSGDFLFGHRGDTRTLYIEYIGRIFKNFLKAIDMAPRESCMVEK